MQLSARAAQSEIRLRYLKYKFLVRASEYHVGDKGICTCGLQLSIATAEVEQQPFHSHGGNDLSRIRDEVAFRYQVLRYGQRCVLKAPDRL